MLIAYNLRGLGCPAEGEWMILGLAGMRMRSGHFFRVCVSIASCISLFGCQFFDAATYEPRSYELNLGTQNLREQLVLLNVVRASRFEPLNFTTLSKYTASGSVNVGGGLTKNVGVDYELVNKGTSLTSFVTAGATPANVLGITAGGNTSNSFDVVSLDNSEFYNNFLQTLTPENVNLLVNAGLSREVVFYSVIKAIDINLSSDGRNLFGGVYPRLRFFNDPANATWAGIPREDHEASYNQCECEAQREFDRLADPYAKPRWAPFTTPFWTGRHVADCSYQKARLLIEAALRYGVTTKVISRSQGAQQTKIDVKKEDNQTFILLNPAQASSSGSGGGRTPGLGNADQKVILCFDPTIAVYYNQKVQYDAGQICPEETRKKKSTSKTSTPPPTDFETLLTQPLPTHLGKYDESMVPILRSPYGVFQYYGSLLKSKHAPDVTQIAEQKTGSRTLFEVRPEWPGCFVHVNYAGGSYCVPEENAGNTKEVLTVLIALVNLSTVRNSLPYTSSVIAQPR